MAIDFEDKDSEPSFGQKAGAVARGAITGLVGGPGELEEFGAYTVPEWLGYREEGAPKEKFLGRETLFPTTKEVSQVLSKAGWKKPGEEVSGYETGGEILGGFGAAIPGMVRKGATTLLGKPTQTSEAYGKMAEKLGFKLSPSQVRGDVPLPSKGATFWDKNNQYLANKLASQTTGKEAAEISESFIRGRYKDLGKDFDKLYKGKTFNIDQDAVNAIDQLARIEQFLPANAQVSSVKNTANKIIENYQALARKPGAQAGSFQIEGEMLQRIRNDLVAAARKTSGQDARQIYELVDVIDSSIARNHPAIAAELSRIRPLYKNTVILDDLYSKGGIRQGNISLEDLGTMVKSGGVKRGAAGPLEQLGEMGRELQLRARWQKEGGAAAVGEDILGKALGTGGDIASTLTGARSRPARAVQRYYAGQPDYITRFGLGFGTAPAAIAGGTLTRPLKGGEEE